LEHCNILSFLVSLKGRLELIVKGLFFLLAMINRHKILFVSIDVIMNQPSLHLPPLDFAQAAGYLVI